MDENRLLKVLNEFGVNNKINDEDYQLYEDYFSNRDVPDSSDESESSVDGDINTVQNNSLENVTLLSDIPVIGENVSNYDINIVDDVIIEIEGNSDNAQVVNEEDAGADVLVVEPRNNEIALDYNQHTDVEEVTNFLERGCGCNKVCCRKFHPNDLVSMRQECAELDFYESNVNKLDQVILGQLRCLTLDSSETARSKQKQTERKRARASYLLKGEEVCKNTFMFAHNIKEKRMKRLTKMYRDSGIVCKPHGNAGKVAKNVTSFQSAQLVVKFLQNFSEQNAILLPGRGNTVYNANAQSLPSNETKRSVYNKYTASFINDMNEKPVSYRVFSNIWRECCGYIVVMKPRSDICDTCKKHYTSGAQMAQATVEEKMQNLEKMSNHLELVSQERGFYQKTIKDSRDSFNADVNIRCEPNSAALKKAVHYSFDMAQQVHIPSDPMQPGPIYFLVPYKIGLFGVMCDTTNKQINYLIPESLNIGKGSNLIVSLFHDYLSKFSHGEETMFVHADNCVGQNKNNIMIGYLAWRVFHDMNKKVMLSFMPVGHTKFSCDWGFGLLKKKFRTCYVSSMSDLIETIEQSTPTSKVNSAVSVCDEAGVSHVPIFDWLSFFAEKGCKKVPRLTRYNHFEFLSSKKGVVNCKSALDGNIFVHNIFPTTTDETELCTLEGFPNEIPPNGLTQKRKQYLFKNIRQYCKEEFKDIICPEVPDDAIEEEGENPDEPAENAAQVKETTTARRNKRKRSI